LSEELSFPCLDLLRLLIIHPVVCQYYIEHADFVNNILTRFAQKTGVSKGGRIMATRLAANFFANPAGGIFMVGPQQVTLLIEAFVNVINAEDIQAKAAAAVLVYNMSLYLPRDDSDATTQAITSILYQLPHEEDQQTQYNLLAALGHMLYCNDDGVGLCVSLGFDVGKWLGSEVPRIVEIAKDVQMLL